MARALWAAALVGVLALTAAGCKDSASPPGAFYGNDTDMARAQAVWRDPWAAPSSLSVAGVRYGSNDLVNRQVGARRTTHLGLDPLAAANSEVRSALRADWGVVGATCAADDVRVVLTHLGPDAATKAAAELTVKHLASSEPGSEATVIVRVPHHLDTDWSWPRVADPVRPAVTCLRGGDQAPAPELPDDPPRGPEVTVHTPEWSEDDQPREEHRAARAAIEADPWFESTGATLNSPDLESGHGLRFAPNATGRLQPGPTNSQAALRAAVSSMTGWTLTWISCGPGTDASATLRLDAEDAPVVARLDAPADGRGAVAWTVTLPIVGQMAYTWSLDVEPVGRSLCLSGATPERRVSDGTPESMPAALQPMR
jgi:hypothetical protein